MNSLETRLQAIEDRLALEDRLIAYCSAIDSLSDMDALLDCFTEDAVFDLGGIDLPRFDGHDGIRGFFKEVFNDMSHHAHFITNFQVNSLQANDAHCTAYIIGMGRAHDGREILVYVHYFLDFVRTDGGWKIKKFGETGLMPLPPELTGVHGRD